MIWWKKTKIIILILLKVIVDEISHWLPFHNKQVWIPQQTGRANSRDVPLKPFHGDKEEAGEHWEFQLFGGLAEISVFLRF